MGCSQTIPIARTALKMNFYFTFERRECLDLFSATIYLRTFKFLFFAEEGYKMYQYLVACTQSLFYSLHLCRLQIFYSYFQQKENDCCDLPVADLTITMLLRRRTYYYVMSLILPCTLIACTIFLEFILPAESGERVGLGITILLSMAVFQELTSEKLPSSSEHFPLLGKNHAVKTSVSMLGDSCW